MKIALAIVVTVLVALSGRAQTHAAAVDSAGNTAGIFIVRPDPRECPSPLCGGYWVSLANHARTRCSDGLLRPRCYVADVVQTDAREPSALASGALAKGVLGMKDSDEFGQLGVLNFSASWAPVARNPATGDFFRLRDTGVRCVRAPCFSIRARVVNASTRSTLVSSLDLGPARSGTVRHRAEAALSSPDGLLLAGAIVRAADGGRVCRASQVYLKSS